tara:strand:- start:304 stop:513 length:210 start_codon:yes stop_codon:yes gene_type:complete
MSKNMLPEGWTVRQTDCGTTCLIDEDGFLVASRPDYDEVFRRLSAALHWASQNASPTNAKIKKQKPAKA